MSGSGTHSRGGQSTRLGSDKGLFCTLGDEPLFARSIRLLGKKFAEILIVVRDEQQADRYRDKLHTILDERFLQSTRILCDLDTSLDAPRAAITGIKTALSEATQDAIIAVPVDFVGVRSAHLNSLINGSHEAIAACFGAESQLEAGLLPFPSFWRR